MNFLFKAEPELKLLDFSLLFLRIFIIAFILTHGVPKLMMILEGGEIKFGDPVGLGAEVSLYLSAFAEFLCAAFVLIGLFTRLTLIPLIINMTTAAFFAHAGQAFSNRELALMYLVVFIFLFITGAGKYSIDYLIQKKKKEV